MENKTDMDIFLEYVPFFTLWYKLLLSFLYHFTIFIVLLVFFWLATSTFWVAAILVQFLITSISNVPLMFMLKDINKTREKYLKKYKELPWQHLWLHHSFTSPFGAAALYIPLILRTNYYIIPSIIDLPSNFFTNSIFPDYMSIVLGAIIVVFGILLIGPSRDKDRDMGNYLLVMRPENNRLYTDGIYEIIRHPRYLSRFIIALGFGIFSNNLLAISVAIVHYIPYCVFMVIADNALIKNFGEEIKDYQKKVPALLPRFGDWIKFFKIVLRFN